LFIGPNKNKLKKVQKNVLNHDKKDNMLLQKLLLSSTLALYLNSIRSDQVRKINAFAIEPQKNFLPWSWNYQPTAPTGYLFGTLTRPVRAH